MAPCEFHHGLLGSPTAMAEISREECRTLAQLARLSLDDDEVERFSGQLSPIVGYLKQLQAVDVDEVPEHLPPSRPGSALREDAVGAMLTREAALAGVPEVREQQVVVPKFKED